MKAKKLRLGITIPLSICLCLYLTVAFGWPPVTELISHGIVDAPNKGKKFAQIATVAPPSGVRALTVPVDNGNSLLSIWIINPRGQEAAATILVLPGIRDRKTSMVGVGNYFAGQGFCAVLVDLPGQGSSTGDYLTYGAKESHALSRLIDQLGRDRLIAGPIGVYGASYGGASAILLASIDARVRAVVAVDTFSNFREEVHAFAADALWARWIPATELDRAITRAAQIAGFNPDEAAPVRAIPKIRFPILLLHGSSDTTIPYSQAEANKAAGYGYVELKPIAGANHKSVFQDGNGALVSKEAATWFKTRLPGPSPGTARSL